MVCTAPYAVANEGISYTIRNLQLLSLQANGLIQAAQSQIHMAESGVVGAEAYQTLQTMSQLVRIHFVC